jgi:serine/threonine protein kinase
MYRKLCLRKFILKENGFLSLYDFGLAIHLKDGELDKEFCGFTFYMAPPEIMGNDFAADWWSVGIMIFEMLFGIKPFLDSEPKFLLEKICKGKIPFPDKNKYNFLSDEFVDICQRLLDKNMTTRLGSNGGASEIMAHPFFASINRGALVN